MLDQVNITDSNFENLIADSQSKIQLWNRILRATKVKTMVEVGVWKGNFAAKILKRCKFIEKYYMIDPWAKLPDWNKPFNVDTEAFAEVYAEAMDKTAFASEKIIVLRGRTKEVIEQIPDESLDFAYIDGDHTLRGITIDLIKLLPKIKENGLIGGDDFTNNLWQHDRNFEPTLVFPFSIYFAEAMDLPIRAMPFSQFLIQKRADVSFSFINKMRKYNNLSLNSLE
ncbi:MAG: class I SAM-dependent methyltransferase [Cyanobacteria bacterium P01_F01_bin.143]